MKILFLGLFYDEEGLKQSYSEVKSGVQMAPHRFQTLLIKGLEENGVEVQSLNVLPGGTFPFNHRRLCIKDKRWGKENLRIGYLNLPFIKQRTQEKKAYRYMKTALASSTPPDYIVCYYTHLPYLRALNRIKKEFPDIKTALIMTEAVWGRGDIVDTPRAKKEGDKVVALSKVFDAFLPITKHLKEPLEMGERPYMVLDGVADESAQKAKPFEGERKVFLYTGTIHKHFNLDTLIAAFSHLPEAELWLCGNLQDVGDAAQKLEDLPNVKYLGRVPFEDLQGYRDGCAYLINPRQPTGSYTRYSFPSKLTECLISGKPTVGYLLEGIGEEYYPYIQPLHAKDAKGLAEELGAIIQEDYAVAKERAEQARSFILREKTAKSQAKKVKEFLEKI